mmetsp:Transcript_107216/g.298149  ORF Transcript_107216/g.298149 Transcript_107216/m.298149 type:complete len:170 (-) Transcript_107216:493-1002(-)
MEANARPGGRHVSSRTQPPKALALKLAPAWSPGRTPAAGRAEAGRFGNMWPREGPAETGRRAEVGREGTALWQQKPMVCATTTSRALRKPEFAARWGSSETPPSLPLNNLGKTRFSQFSFTFTTAEESTAGRTSDGDGGALDGGTLPSLGLVGSLSETRFNHSSSSTWA